MKRKLIIFVIGTGLIAIIVGLKIWLSPDESPDPDLVETKRLVETEYFGNLKPDWPTYESVELLVQALPDRYSRVLTKAEKQRYQGFNQGDYSGVGLGYERTDTGLLVYQVLPNSPAADAQIVPGDSISRVNDVPAIDLTDSILEELFYGSVPPQLQIRQQNSQRQTTLHAKTFSVPSVEYRLLLSGMGYIKIYLFTETTDEELRLAVDTLVGAGIDSLVIDLRGNGGGSSGTSLELANDIVPVGFLVHRKDRKGESFGVQASGQGKLLGLNQQVVVLVDKHTASEAEMLAAALKDNGRVTVIGETTYGKGLVVSIFDLPSEKGLLLVTGEWTRPNLESVEGVGIRPDVFVEDITDWSAVPWKELYGH